MTVLEELLSDPGELGFQTTTVTITIIIIIIITEHNHNHKVNQLTQRVTSGLQL